MFEVKKKNDVKYGSILYTGDGGLDIQVFKLIQANRKTIVFRLRNVILY